MYPCAATTTYENFILIPRLIASSIISDCGLTLESKIIGLIPFFLNSIAVSYPLSLFVKTNGFLPIMTAAMKLQLNLKKMGLSLLF